MDEYILGLEAQLHPPSSPESNFLSGIKICEVIIKLSAAHWKKRRKFCFQTITTKKKKTSLVKKKKKKRWSQEQGKCWAQPCTFRNLIM